jgi:hypothetical protein
MNVIDEDGRLFGVINILDFLIIMLSLAIVVAGISVLGIFSADQSNTANGGGDGNPPNQQTTPINRDNRSAAEVRYATVTVDSVNQYLSAAVLSSNNVTVRGTEASVVKTYRTPAESGVRLILLVRLNGEAAEDSGSFSVAGQPVRLGERMTVTAATYQVTGRVTALRDTSDSFRIEPVAVRISARVPSTVADEVTPGDKFVIGEESVASIRNVSKSEIKDSSKVRMSVQIIVHANLRGGKYNFSGETLRLGTNLPFRTSRYEFSGRIISIEQ